MEPARPIALPVHRPRRAGRAEVPPAQCCGRTLPAAAAAGCGEEQDEILAEELLRVMHLAASKIQALWRGYCARKQLYIEQGAAVLLQAFWRGCRVRRLLREPVSRPLRIHGQHLLWDRGGAQSLCSPRREADPKQKPRDTKRVQDPDRHPAPQQLLIKQDPKGAGGLPCPTRLPDEQLCRLACQNRLPVRQSCGRVAENRLAVRQACDRAATVIQAHWRGYLARRDLAIRIGAAVYIQSFYRGYRVRSKLSRSPDPQDEPQDEEAEMVSFNMSFSRGYPGTPPNNGGRFGTKPDNCSSGSNTRHYRYPSFPPPEDPRPLSARGDTRQSVRARYVPLSGEGNPHWEPLHRKADNPVPGYFTRGAGDSGCSVDAVSRPAPPAPACAGPLKQRQVNLLSPETRSPWEEVVSRLEEGAPGPGFASRALVRAAAGVEPQQPVAVSQYLVQSSPYASGGRRLIRYREQLSPQPRDSQQTDPSRCRASGWELDFDLSDLEVPRDAAACPPEQPARRSLKRLREESAAARTIQAAWKGLRTRRALQQQATAATKIQATFRSYQTRKEFESEGIYPLVRPKAPGRTRACPPGAGTVPAPPQPGGDTEQTVPDAALGEREAPLFAPLCAPGVPVQESADARSSRIDHWARRCVRTRRQHQERARAATVIQAAWRGHRARRELAGRALAAARIQALYRGYQIRKFLASIGKHPEGARQSGGPGDRQPGGEPQTQAGGYPERPGTAGGHRAGQAAGARRLQEASRRAQLKAESPAIYVKRNPCYNPRKVTIHVKASTADVS